MKPESVNMKAFNRCGFHAHGFTDVPVIDKELPMHYKINLLPARPGLGFAFLDITCRLIFRRKDMRFLTVRGVMIHF